ncbi:hypothetical protein HYS99_00555 [Candidatus Giovannonibacteria bacterium]|nr:hypothetical protein [Candidatus Giovannonibacteria bacterium]
MNILKNFKKNTRGRGGGKSLQYVFGVLVIFMLLITISSPTLAAEDNATYKLIQPLPGTPGSGGPITDVGGDMPFAQYMQRIIPFILAFAALLALVQIVVGGFEYGLSAIPGIKVEGKDRITSALWGLGLALISWLILRTINPDLVNLKFFVPRPVGLSSQSSPPTQSTKTNDLQQSGAVEVTNPNSRGPICPPGSDKTCDRNQKCALNMNGTNYVCVNTNAAQSADSKTAFFCSANTNICASFGGTIAPGLANCGKCNSGYICCERKESIPK